MCIATISPPWNDKTSNMNGSTRKAVVTPCPVLTEDQVRAALILHVSKHHCYGRDAAKGLKMTTIQPSSAFHVCLIHSSHDYLYTKLLVTD